MEKIAPKADFVFIPNEIEVNDGVARISKVCKMYFDGFKELGGNVYIIEQDVQATCEGDFQHHFLEGQRGHSPFIFLKKFKEGFEDTLSTPLLVKKPLLNGSMTWEIPTRLYDASNDTAVSDAKPETIMDSINLLSEDQEPNFEAIDKRFKLIKKVTVVQKFILENGVLYFEKGGYRLFSLDLKQYPTVFECFK